MNIKKSRIAICLKRISSQLLSLGIVLFICSGVISSASAAKLYKWVDNDGNISYQDQPPPKSAKILEESEIAASAAPSSDSDTGSAQLTPVTVYTVDGCDACELLMVRFRQLGVSAQEQSLSDPAVQQRILDLGEGLSAPTLFVGDNIVTDLSDSTIISELVKAGYGPENSNISSSDIPEADESESESEDEPEDDFEDEEEAGSSNSNIEDLIAPLSDSNQ